MGGMNTMVRGLWLVDTRGKGDNRVREDEYEEEHTVPVGLPLPVQFMKSF